MNFNFNIFSNTLLMSGAATFFLALFIILRLGNTVKWFGILMLLIATWSLGYALELASSTLEQMFPFIYVEYVGIAYLPAAWLIFTLEFSNLKKWITPFNTFLIFLFPSITYLMVITNNYHHLHYQSVFISLEGPFPMMGINPGVWYYFYTVYFYFALILGNYFLLKNYFILKKQSRAIVIASFFPWISNVLYLTGVRPYAELDLTPYAFIISSGTIAFSMLRLNLFTIIPVAHEKIIKNMHQALLIVDIKGNIIDVNNSMSRYIDLPLKQMIGKNVNLAFSAKPEWKSILTQTANYTTDVSINDRYYEINTTQLIDDKEKSAGTIFMALDITERKNEQKKLQEQTNQLIELNEIKDKLFSILAHDLRSPLANLTELLHMLKNDTLNEDEFKNFIAYLSQNVEYTSDLLDNLLEWSKSQIKRESINPQSFDIFSLVENQLSYFKKPAANKNITMISNIRPGSFVFADKEMIRLVLRNLISNAVKFCNANDTITINSITNNGYVTIQVSDTGVGMSKESVQKLFNKGIFSTQGTNNEQGTGLGLMLCKEFIEKNGGTLQVETELGKGSTFRFSLKSN